jgi:putative effector of murein hydrolase/putative effector of murein hydrolase LrgA (UPF0299 family)
VQTGAGIAAAACVDFVATRALERWALRFPGFVAALVATFLGLLFARLFKPSAVDRLVLWGAPAAIFLSRWMALFFVPPLVLLGEGAAPSVKDLVLLVVLGGGGFVVSFWTTGAIAERLNLGLEVARNEPWHSPPPWPKRALLWGWGSVALVSALARWATGSEIATLGLGVGLSVFAFVLAEVMRTKVARLGHDGLAALCHPVLVSAALIAASWSAMGLRLDQYLVPSSQGSSPGGLLSALLRPSVVSLALALDAQRRLLRAQASALFLATAWAAAFSLLGTAFVAGRLGLSPDCARALVPRSVTTPVALSIAELLGANGGLTAVIVILTGVCGAVFAPMLAHRFGFKSPVVLGIATGATSHGVGTASLAREHPVAAAFSGIAFALVAVFCTVLVSIPRFRELLLALL